MRGAGQHLLNVSPSGGSPGSSSSSSYQGSQDSFTAGASASLRFNPEAPVVGSAVGLAPSTPERPSLPMGATTPTSREGSRLLQGAWQPHNAAATTSVGPGSGTHTSAAVTRPSSAPVNLLSDLSGGGSSQMWATTAAASAGGTLEAATTGAAAYRAG